MRHEDLLGLATLLIITGWILGSLTEYNFRYVDLLTHSAQQRQEVRR